MTNCLEGLFHYWCTRKYAGIEVAVSSHGVLWQIFTEILFWMLDCRSVAYVCTVMWLHYQAKLNVKCVWRPAYKYRALMIRFSELECMKCSKILASWNIMLCILVCRYPCFEEHIAGIFSTAQVTLLGLPWKCWQYAPPAVILYIPFFVVSYRRR